MDFAPVNLEIGIIQCRFNDFIRFANAVSKKKLAAFQSHSIDNFKFILVAFNYSTIVEI